MIFWIVAGALCAAAIGLLLLPLLRQPKLTAARADYDVNVYRNQLAEIEREVERGEIDAEAAAAARTEVERLILAAADTAAEPAKTSAAAPRAALWGVGLGLAAILPAATIGLYLGLGNPGVPSQPFAERAPAQSADQPQAAGDLNDMAQRLTERLATDPNNREGWLLLGRTRGAMGQFDQAVEAYKQAIAQGFDDAITQSALGEALAARDQGSIGPEARRAFAAALEHDPDNPRARYYAGLALVQDGRLQEAMDLWVELIRQSPPDAPWLTVVATQVRQAASQLGVDPPDLSDLVARQAPAPGPSQADVQAAQELSAEERAKFIRSMVGRLAERLEQEPEDFDGWLRLAQAYGVLGEPAKAKDALGRADALVQTLPQDAPERAQLEQLRRALFPNG